MSGQVEGHPCQAGQRHPQVAGSLMTNRREPSRLFILVAGCVLSASAWNVAQSTSNSQSQHSTLKDLEPELGSKTQVPLRLPKLLPDTGGQKIFAVLRHADANGYDILLATKLPCEGGNACSYGTVQASRSPLEPVEGRPTTVSLRKGIVGRFFPAKCYAFCSDAYIRWNENGVSYSIGVKGGKKTGLLSAARSALPNARKTGDMHDE